MNQSGAEQLVRLLEKIGVHAMSSQYHEGHGLLLSILAKLGWFDVIIF